MDVVTKRKGLAKLVVEYSFQKISFSFFKGPKQNYHQFTFRSSINIIQYVFSQLLQAFKIPTNKRRNIDMLLLLSFFG